MWEYTDKVKDHFMNPRNVGVIEDADGIGEVGSLSCGDALKLTFKLGEDEKIKDAKAFNQFFENVMIFVYFCFGAFSLISLYFFTTRVIF